MKHSSSDTGEVFSELWTKMTSVRQLQRQQQCPPQRQSGYQRERTQISSLTHHLLTPLLKYLANVCGASTLCQALCEVWGQRQKRANSDLEILTAKMEMQI